MVARGLEGIVIERIPICPAAPAASHCIEMRPALGVQPLSSTVPLGTSGVPASLRIMAQPVTPGSKGAQCENEVIMRDGSTQFKSCAQPARAVATHRIKLIGIWGHR